MSVGIFVLKVGLAVTVTGASIVTPILLNRDFGGSSVAIQDSRDEGVRGQDTGEEIRPDAPRTENSVVGNDSSENVASSSEREDSSVTILPSSEVQQRENQAIDSSDQVNPTDTVSGPPARLSKSEEDTTSIDSEGESDTQRSGVSRDALRQSSSSTRETSQPLTTRAEDFDKKCFIVPATSNDGENIELLTCYSEKDIIRKNFEERDPEYSSLFHVYDKRGTNNPVEINESLMWNPENRQLTASLTETVLKNKEYSFTAKGDEWSRVSSATKNLMGRYECAIYKVSPEVSSSSFLLTCGNYFHDYEPGRPEGIPLTVWGKRN